MPGWKVTGTGGKHRNGVPSQPAIRRIDQSSVQLTTSIRRPSWLPFWFGAILKRALPSLRSTVQRLPPILYVGVAQYEEPLADVASTDFRRARDARCNPVAHALKVSGDVAETEGQMTDDVLEEDVSGCDLADDPANVGPEMARIALSEPSARQGEGLAGISTSDDRYLAAPRAAVEGSQVRPDRCISQGLVRHPRHENRRGEDVSLDIAHSSISGFCEVQAEIQSSNA